MVLVPLVGAMLSSGCDFMSAQVVHPPELTGKWVRLRADGTWGDTLSYLADGGVRGSPGHPIPASARWVVVRSKAAGEGFCVGDDRDRSCRPFRLEGDTLVVGDISSPAYYRRAQ
jgi:hypothetical protein